jgi:di/tricarboxylate transporter
LQGPDTEVEALRDDRDLLLLTPVAMPAVRRHKGWLAMAIVAGVMIGVSVGHIPVSTVALVGAILLVLTGCLDMNEAYSAINWNVIMLIIGTLGLGLALENSGGAAYLAHYLNGWFGTLGPWIALSGTYLVAVVLTEMLSNTAVAALMTPVAISSAAALGCDARPFVMAVMIAASAGFASPIGYQTHTMVYGAGGYKFTDYLKIGIPLEIICWLLATLLIPVFWPFKP